MTFEQFRNNVESWAEVRGIYEHSTALAQALKACSEAGELCDALIKNDREAMIDAVGDVAVCLVNAWRLHAPESDIVPVSGTVETNTATAASQIVINCGRAVQLLSAGASVQSELEDALYWLQDFCAAESLDFLACCASAWDQIKDRKGRMVAGGAFVKE